MIAPTARPPRTPAATAPSSRADAGLDTAHDMTTAETTAIAKTRFISRSQVCNHVLAKFSPSRLEDSGPGINWNRAHFDRRGRSTCKLIDLGHAHHGRRRRTSQEGSGNRAFRALPQARGPDRPQSR